MPDLEPCRCSHPNVSPPCSPCEGGYMGITGICVLCGNLDLVLLDIEICSNCLEFFELEWAAGFDSLQVAVAQYTEKGRFSLMVSCGQLVRAYKEELFTWVTGRFVHLSQQVRGTYHDASISP